MSTSVVFDIETHVLQRYTGEARFQRLLSVAAVDPNLAEASLLAALTESKQQRNVYRYKEIYQLGKKVNLPPMDTNWIHDAEKQNRLERDTLTTKLKTAQAHLNKEAIRAAYAALSQHLCKIGEIQEAHNAELQAKEHCTTIQQTATHTLQCLALAIYSQSYHIVQEFVPRLEYSGRKTTESLTAGALVSFSQKDYQQAGIGFRAAAMSEFPPSDVSADWEHTVLAPEDIAMYAAVLTLIEPDRSKAIALADHPAALEAAPILREILLHFHKHANYREASRLLEAHVWPILRYDPNFQSVRDNDSHMNSILKTIRIKAIGQFWKPYSNCPLTMMQESLGETIAGTTEELKETIIHLLKTRRDVLPYDTRYDCQTNTLVRDLVVDGPVAKTSLKLQGSSVKALNDVYSTIVRLACFENEIKVSDPKKRRQNWNRIDSGRHDDDDDDAMVIDMDAMNPEDQNPEDRY